MFNLVVAKIFISVLVLTTKTPNLAWLQWSEPYATKEHCEIAIRETYEQIEDYLEVLLRGHLVSIREYRCMTNMEAANLNRELDH